jgi:hypothetical protein
MKKFLFAACLTVAVSSSFATEMILNGGLENWTAGAPDSWSISCIDSTGGDGGTARFTISQDSSVFHSGASSLKAVNSGSQFTFRYFAHSNSFQLQSAQPFLASAWLRCSIANTSLRMCRGFLNGSTWNVDTTGQVNYTGTAGTWQNLTNSTWNLSSNVSRISFHNIPASTANVDDLSVDGVPLPVEVSAFMLE